MKILLLNQCFYPDVVSTAQHLTDLALELTRRGHSVTVVAGRRGYDEPKLRFAGKESWRGISIIRIPSTGLGKSSRLYRTVDFGSFILSCLIRLLTLPRFDAVVALTSPPLISFLAALSALIKRERFYFWVMDLNPDEAIAAGWLRKNSMTAKTLAALLMYSIRKARRLIVLDRFMKNRLLAKGADENKIMIVPPWSHDAHALFSPDGRAKFRAARGLADKFVVMYSGNHSPCHPLDSLLQAALQLADNPDIYFLFVGGGSEYKKAVAFAEHHELKNVDSLPYQPLDRLAESLSSADLHVAIMGEPFVGIVHPCKIYNILSIGSPFLYIGPDSSHIEDIIKGLGESNGAYSARHGDVGSIVGKILEVKRNSHGAERGAFQNLAKNYSAAKLIPKMIEALECAPVEGTKPGLGWDSVRLDFPK